MPKSPVYVALLTFSLFVTGDSINTEGAFVDVYPTPGPVTVIVVTIPAVMELVAVALCVDPRPTGSLMNTSGAEVYPEPPTPIVIEETVPAKPPPPPKPRQLRMQQQ